LFDWKKPTTQMLGRWQPLHAGHTALFKKALHETGQVCIMIRDVGGIVGSDAGAGRTAKQDDNPFDYVTVVENIKAGLAAEGFDYDEEYIIMQVPNIVDISYGRGVGYTFTQHDLGEETHNISATKIRKQLRDEGKLSWILI
jgi:FAD synthase